MTGSPTPCTFCRAPEDIGDMKLINNCDLSDGEPCSACKDYMAIEAKISAAKQVLDDLIIQRTKIRSSVNQNHDLLTSRVPLEIVCSVFQFCVPTNLNLDVLNCEYVNSAQSEENKWIHSGPFLLGRICKTWRNIVWRTEALWTTFRLFLKGSNHPDWLDLARKWLERAGQLPLSIHLSTHYFNELTEEDREALYQLIDELTDRSKQWRSLDISAYDDLFYLFEESLNEAPNLQTLRIGYPFGAYSLRNRVLLPFAYVKLRLRHLSMHGYHLRSIGAEVVEWNQLTSVFLSRLSLDDAIELLRRAPGLVSYTLYEVVDDPKRFPRPSEPVIYGALESLEIRCPPKCRSQSERIIAFFKSFIFPSLKHLKVESGGRRRSRENQLSWAAVIDHIKKSSPPLISLTIQYLGPLPFSKCISRILRRTPLLRDLEILTPISILKDEDNEAIGFFQLLSDTSIPNNTGKKFLSNLRSIKLSVEHESKDGSDEFWSCIPEIFGPISDIHNPHRRPLKTLRVQSVSKSFYIGSDDVTSQLRVLKAEGIVLDIRDKLGHDVFEEVVEVEGPDEWIDREDEDEDVILAEWSTL